MLLLFGLAAAAQTPSAPATIEGTVLNSLTGQPVRKAHLSLYPLHPSGPIPDQPIAGATDAQGKYKLLVPTAGTFRLTVSHDGYQVQVYGASKTGEGGKGEPLEIKAGESKSKIDLRMTPYGAIIGRVVDENGDPVRQVEVAVMKYIFGPKGKSLQPINNTQTDALGEYRIFDLPAGKYYLRAKPMSAQLPGLAESGDAYMMVYYPNVAETARATQVSVSAGQEQRGIDFILQPSAAAFIRGRIVKPAGSGRCRVSIEGGDDDPMMGVADSGGGSLLVMTSSGGETSSVNVEDFEFPGSHKVGEDGAFEFRQVPVGSHTITGRCAVGKQTYTAKTVVQLDASGLSNVELRALPPSVISGKIRIEGDPKFRTQNDTGTAFAFANTHVFLEERGQEAVFEASGTPDDPAPKPPPDGTFTFRDLMPNVYHLQVETPPGVYLKAVTVDGRDIQDSGIDVSAGSAAVTVDVLLSANGASVDGVVDNGDGAKVILIPADPKLARLQSRIVEAGADGHFSVSDLAPGRYTFFAWDAIDPDTALYDPDFRKPFESSAPTIEVTERQKATLQQKLTLLHPN